MLSKKNFIIELEKIVDFSSLSEDIQEYWNVFKTEHTKEKPPFTDNGKLILAYLKEHTEQETWRANDVAEGLFISGRTVSGAMRKLVTDGYVDKVSTDPVVYCLTDLGKNVIIE